MCCGSERFLSPFQQSVKWSRFCYVPRPRSHSPVLGGRGRAGQGGFVGLVLQNCWALRLCTHCVEYTLCVCILQKELFSKRALQSGWKAVSFVTGLWCPWELLPPSIWDLAEQSEMCVQLMSISVRKGLPLLPRLPVAVTARAQEALYRAHEVLWIPVA